MSVIYRSKRVGRYGKPFDMLKFRTLKDGSDGAMFADGSTYTRFGKFLRATKLDELPQIINILKGQMTWVGPRAEEQRTIDLLPTHVKDIILSVKPGLTSPASIHFTDEEKILQESVEPGKMYWVAIKPMKMVLDVWYVQHKSFLLDVALLWESLRFLITKK